MTTKNPTEAEIMARPDKAASPMVASPIAASPTAARLSFAATTAFLALLAALHLIKPGLDPSWRMVSEYEVGRHGWVMQLAFLCLASGCVALFAAIRSQVRTTSGRIGLAFLLLSAAGMTIAGVFAADPITADPGELTTHGNLHALGAFLGIPGFPVAALLVSRSLLRNPDWSPARRSILWTAGLNWIGLLALVVTVAVLLPSSGGFGPDAPIGWPNRLVLVANSAWLMVVARGAIRSGRLTHRRRP